jgi:hypothetical protein
VFACFILMHLLICIYLSPAMYATPDVSQHAVRKHDGAHTQSLLYPASTGKPLHSPPSAQYSQPNYYTDRKTSRILLANFYDPPLGFGVVWKSISVLGLPRRRSLLIECFYWHCITCFFIYHPHQPFVFTLHFTLLFMPLLMLLFMLLFMPFLPLDSY